MGGRCQVVTSAMEKAKGRDCDINECGWSGVEDARARPNRSEGGRKIVMAGENKSDN